MNSKEGNVSAGDKIAIKREEERTRKRKRQTDGRICKFVVRGLTACLSHLFILLHKLKKAG